MVIGSALNAEKVFSFSGIFDIGKWSGSYNDYLVSECDWYKKHLDDIEYSQYFNVLDGIQRSNVKVYHFYSSKNDADNIQIDEITDSGNIIKIAFNSKNHGKTMIGSNIPYLITADENKLEKVARRFRNRLATKYSFSVKLIGLKETIKICIKKLIKKGKS